MPICRTISETLPLILTLVCNRLCGNVTFLSLNKKVTKEVSQRGARRQCAPFGNPRRHTVLQIKNTQLKTTILENLHFGQKIGTFFVRTGSRLRCSRAFVSAGREILKRASLARGSATTQRLLSRLLLVLFLAKQEKYIFPRNPKEKRTHQTVRPLHFFGITRRSPWGSGTASARNPGTYPPGSFQPSSPAFQRTWQDRRSTQPDRRGGGPRSCRADPDRWHR